MSTHERVMEFINLIKGHKNVKGYDARHTIERVYTNGNCYMFAKTLQFVFPQAIIYSHETFGHHVIARIEDRYYDIMGELTKLRAKFYSPITEDQEEKARTWCYSASHDYGYGLHDANFDRIDRLKELKLNSSHDGWDIDTLQPQEAKMS